jgi:hypothetical protein
VLQYIASPEQCTYSLAELRDWLQQTLQQPDVAPETVGASSDSGPSNIER